MLVLKEGKSRSKGTILEAMVTNQERSNSGLYQSSGSEDCEMQLNSLYVLKVEVTC